MPAYLIARVTVIDWEQYRKYTAATPAAIAKFGGKFMVRGGEIVNLEGSSESRRIVVIQFRDLATAKAFYESPEYSEVRKLREGAATGEFIAVDGWEP